MEALGKMGKSAVKPLSALVNNPRVSVDIRVLAIAALGEIGPDAKGVLAVLQFLAKNDRNQLIREIAKEAVKKISPPK